MNTKSKLSSEWIYRFYNELEKYGIENHGLLIMQNGETVFEEYLYPYSADMPHTLFSVTKSVVSTAVGFAISEGLFSLDSKILPFFPEYKACKSDEWENITVRSLLTMQSNKKFSFTQDMTGNYDKIFMKAAFRKKDRGFLYSNNDVHVIASLIQRLSGMSLVDYLTPRLFEPLGIEIPFWETDVNGECVGGTGCHLKLRDLAKICQCYADGGKYNGIQVIPEEWTKEATKKHVNLECRENEDGYGFYFWIDNGTYSMNGMFGQIVIYYPQYNAIIATTNCVIEDELLYRIIRSVLTRAFENSSSDEWDKKLADYLKARNKKPVACTEKLKIPENKTYYITPLSDLLAGFLFPASLLPRSLSSSLARRPQKNLNKISFSLSENVLTIKWFEESDEVIINCGLDGNPRFSECRIKGYSYKIWAYAYIKNGVLNAVIKPINTLATQYVTFDFFGDTLKMQMIGTPGFPAFIHKNVNQSSFIANSGIFKPIIIHAVKNILKTTEMPMKFKAK